MRTKLFSILFTVLLLSTTINKVSCNDRMSVVYGSQLTNYNFGWDYVAAVVLTAFEQLYLVTGDSAYYNTIETTMNGEVSDYGTFNFMSFSNWTADDVRSACQLLTMYQLTGDEKYRTTADVVFNFVQNAPRTSYGGFWHKSHYQNQMWLDGIYMASPFYVQYDRMFNKPELYDDVAHQVTEMYVHSWDSLAKLPYHGWYDAENNPGAVPPYWADSETGKSPVFWARAIGWYAMAIVDILDYLPKDHSMRDSIIGIFNNLAEGIAVHQDPDSLVWWEVVDQPKSDLNWIESSASCMYVYALAKGVRMGYIDSVYLETATTGYQGILDKFVDATTIPGFTSISDVCIGTGVGGDYAFYVGRPKYYNGHAAGAFILASIEMEMIDSIYPPGLLVIDSVTSGANHISWINNHQNDLGYILERSTGTGFTTIAEPGIDTVFYADSLIEPNTIYTYRVRAYTENDTSRWSNYLKVTSANDGGLPSQAFLPYPVNNAINISSNQVLKWKKGLLTDYHKLYLGTTNPPPFVADIYDAISYTPGNLVKDSTYYWRIDEVNEKGTTIGETWKFSMLETVSAVSIQNTSPVKIFPNPVSEKLNIEGLAINSSISIYDLKGMLYYSNDAKEEKLIIDMQNWQKGIYIIQVKGTKNIIYKKLIVE